MIGLPCSGKTTRAKELEKEYNALRFTPDVWQIKLFGGVIDDKIHDDIEKIMWDTAKRVLTLGVDVILDFGFWSRLERDDFRQRAYNLGAGFKLHYMNVSEDELFRRLETRNNSGNPDVFILPKEQLAEYIKLFQPPSDEELN